MSRTGLWGFWWLFAVAAGLLGGCQAQKQEALSFAIASAPSSLHPLFASDAASERITALLYEPLVDFDTAQQPVPGLIRWERISDKHYRIRLNGQPSSFSDGSLPTLVDIEATLAMASGNARSPHAATLSHLTEVVHRGDWLDVHLSRPDPRFPEKLHLGLAPADRLSGGALARQPVGSGAFVFERWDAQNTITLLRKSDGQPVRFEVVPDPTMRALKLMRGEVQLLQNDLPYELYSYLTEQPGVRLQESPGSTFSYLGFNLEDQHTGDRRVRLAIAHAIDREAIVEHLFRGHAQLTNTLLRPEHWAAHRELTSYAHDPNRSLALLAELGYSPENPLKLSYKTSTDPFRLRVAAALQAQLQEVGIELHIESYEWGTFFADIKAGNFQLYSLSWVGIRSPDIFRYIYHSDSLPPKGANRGRYRAPEVDLLIDKADQATLAIAATVYHQVQARVHHDLVYVPLWHENNLLLSRNVGVVKPSKEGAYDFLERVSLAHE